MDEREGRVMDIATMLREIEDALNIWQTGYEHAMTLVGEWRP